MRVLFIFHMASMKGGASKSGLSLVKGLKDSGHEIFAVTPAEGTLANELRNAGISVKLIRFDWVLPCFRKDAVGAVKFIPAAVRNFFFNKTAYSELLRYAQEISPDIIHSNSSVINVGYKVAKKLNIPHVTHFREIGFSDCGAFMPHKKEMLGYRYQYSIGIGKIVFESHSLGVSHKNKVIYNGIVDAGQCRENNSAKQFLLFVGGLFKSKGIEDLLIAYSKLPMDIKRMYPLKIAGSTPIESYFSKLKSLAEKLGITEYVEWLGERNDIDDLMFGARALLVPSHNEGFGRIVIEALRNGTLVIGRNNAGIKEQFDNGVELTGGEIGLRYSAIDELTDRMLDVCRSNSQKYDAFIKRGQTTICNLYSVQQYIDNVDRFYKFAISDWHENQCNNGLL